MTHRLHLPCGSIALVDDEDAPLLVGWSWYRLRKNGEPTYVVGERTVDGKKERVLLSRHLTGAVDTEVVDHKHGDLLDNSRSGSLRPCTQQQNLQNRRVAKTNKLGLKGVHLAPDGRRYRAVIGIGGRSKSIGGFDSPLKAARAYDRAAIDLYGEFARLNFSPSRDWLFPHEHIGTWPPLTAAEDRSLDDKTPDLFGARP